MGYESSSDRWKNSLSNRIIITGICLLLIGAIPATMALREDLQQIYDRKSFTSGALSGWNLTQVGDINNDGNMDYGMGSPGENKAYIIYGPAPYNFNPASAGWSIGGPSDSDFGWDIQGIGDYNDDDFDDFIVGAPGEDKAYLFNGRSGGQSTTYVTAALQFNGTSGERFGHSVCGLDYSGSDGWYAVIGAPVNEHIVQGIGNVTSGAVFMFDLETAANKTSKYTDSLYATYTFTGTEDNSRFGHIVRNVGDINYDQIDDLGMGDPYYSPSGYTNKGAFYFQFGKDIPEPEFKETNALDGQISGTNLSGFGWSAKGLGDIGGSFEDDLIIGAPFELEGKAYLFFGVNGTFSSKDLASGDTADNEFNGTNQGDLFGWSFDRTMISGTTNIISISAPGYDNGTQTDAGAVYSFWSWAASESANDAKSAYFGDNANERLGYSICEINYTMSNDDNVIGILASSPFHGSNDAGRLQILKRNHLPSLSSIFISDNVGSESKEFTIRMEYTDLDDDAPQYMKVYFYYDINGDNLAKEVTLDKVSTDTSPFSEGVTYEKVTTLPNSISRESPNEKLYMVGRTRAVRGSMSLIDTGALVQGPSIDGINPSAPDNLNIINWETLPDEEKIPGTFKISWEWPEDNDMTGSEKSEKVSLLEIRYVQGNTTMDEATWDSATVYKTFQASEAKDAFARDELLIGADDPNIKPFLYYSVAMRAYDDVGNEGNISATLNPEAYWRRPSIPDPCTSVIVSDYKGEDEMGDNGGQLLVNFAKPQIILPALPSDIGYYEVYVAEAEGFDRENLSDYNNIDWEPDMIITPEDEEAYVNNTFIIESYHAGDLQDGTYYYIAVVPVNWLDEHSRIVTWSESPPVKVINDLQNPIPLIKDVDGISINGENQIRVTWTPTNLDRFVQYEIYGQSYSYNNIDDAVRLAVIDDMGTSEFIVEDISGAPISQSSLYSFSVLVKDHNDHMDITVDLNNTVKGVKYINPDSIIPAQIKGVSMLDAPNDGGAALTLSWFRTFADDFWNYRVYFSDSEITDVSTMEPYAVISGKQNTDISIDEFDDEPLMDGRMYYAVVTIVDWDLEENFLVDANNSAMAEPINQSDFEAPAIFPGSLSQTGEVTNTEFSISWTPISEGQVPDFSHYLVTVTGPKGSDDIIVDGSIGTDSLLVDGLTRGTSYYVNISIVDDNGNRGIGSSSIEVMTTGADQPPTVVKIIVTVGEELYNMNNSEELDVDLNEFFTIYFTGEGEDDYTASSRLLYFWNISLPNGDSIEKTSYTFNLDLSEKGTYNVKLVVRDQAGMDSDAFEIVIHADKDTEGSETPTVLIIIIVIVAIILAIVVVLFVLFSGSRSQKKQKMEEYRERRQDIDAMEPIYANLPSWTCDCGTTQVAISENAYCNSCYQSHEAVPIDGIDEYLREHDLVLAEMKISVPPGWQGQDVAKDDAEKDLEERKKRAREALNEEYAQWLRGTEYESELEELPQKTSQEEGPKEDKLHHEGAIVPGQMPPSGPITPQVQSGPIRPMVGGQPAGQVTPPAVPPQGAPGQKPPMPQVGVPQQRPPQQPQQ